MHGTHLGIALKLGATLSFTLMYAVIKLAGDVPVGEVIVFRGGFALVPLFVLAGFTVGAGPMIRTGRPFFHILRSVAGVSSMFMNFAAVMLLPLADVTAFQFVAPIFAVVLAVLILHEQVGHWRWSAVAVGFIGILLMLEPYGGMSAIAGHGLSAGALLALGGSAMSALVIVLIRQMSTTERSETIVFYFMVTCTAVGAITMLWSRTALSPEQIVWLVLCGLLGGIGQICMTFSYRYAEPSLLAPFDYVSMVWAVLLGYFVFAEVPQPMVMIGAGVVIAAGLFIVWRERVRHRRALAARAASPL